MGRHKYDQIRIFKVVRMTISDGGQRENGRIRILMLVKTTGPDTVAPKNDRAG